MMTTARDFRKLDVAIVVLSAITYLVDVATDVLVTVQYMFEGELMWFTLTLSFIVVPMVLMQLFSLKWYIAETNARISFLNGFLHSIGLALLKRYANVLMTWSDVKTSADPALIEKLFLQINDVFLLRMFQCFLESAPQLVLHTYVAISQWYVTISSGFSIFFSLVSLSWGFATYTDILRLTYRDSYQRKWSGLLLQIGWQIGMIISRIMAIVMCGICLQGWLFLPIFVHWLLMTIWIIAEKPHFSSLWWEDKLYSCVVGFIYIFCFLNVQEGRTRWRMFFFYALQMLENTLVVITWMVVDNPLQDIYQWMFTALVYIGFLLGVVCLLLFYGCYHPDKQDKDNSSEEIGQEQPTITVQSLRRSSKRGKLTSSSITSNTSLMNTDGKLSDYKPFPYRREPIGCQDVSADIRFLRINDGTPTFNGSSSKFPAFNHGMLRDDEDVDESATKIFSSTAVDEETPRALKFVRRTTPQLSTVGQTSGDSKISKFGSTKSQLTLVSKGLDGEIDSSQHIGYCPKKGYVLNLKSPPPCQETRDRHPLGRHHSENIKSTTRVSTVDNLAHKYQHFRESWDGSDRYLQMLEKYCDREDRPAKYTYLNSVYEPTTKPMERKIKVSPLTKLRSSFRRSFNAMRNLNYKEMSPVLNTNQYFSSRETLKSNQGQSSLQHQKVPRSESFHSGENQRGMFYNTYHSKEHIANSQKCSQECAYRSSQSCAGSSQCLRRGQGYEQTLVCDHACAHKRRSYSENCPDGQQQPGGASYCMQKAPNSENRNSPSDPSYLSRYPNTIDRCNFYNQPVSSSYLTLPHRQNKFPTGHTTSSAFSQCYPTLRNPPGPYPSYHYPSNDSTTYVVYSDKPSVSRCTSAPPQSYGSLRRSAIVGSRKMADDVLVDDNDFRYCTVSSVRSESAPPSENFVRASFKNQRRLQSKSDLFKSNQETPSYDFRQLTVSPVQSMSVPPDKITDLETLRNLTVSPVRSVSVMPNQSPSPEQECFGNYLQLPSRSASVPPNFFQTHNPPNFPVSRASAMSDSSDTSFSYGTSTDRPTTPSSSQHCNDNFIYGKMAACSDGAVSIPPVSQINYELREKFSAPSNPRTTTSDSDSVGHSHQDDASDSSVFSYKHPYLPERKVSVPYSRSQSTTSSEGDSQSLSSLPDSACETLSRNGMQPSGDSEKEGAETDPWFQEGQKTIQRNNNSNTEGKSSKNQMQANGISCLEAIKEESNQAHHREKFKRNSSEAKPLENYPSTLKNVDKSKSMNRMSSHVHGGISIEPSNTDNKTTYEDAVPQKRQDQAALIERSHKVQEDPSVAVEQKGFVPTKTQESTLPVHLQKEMIKKPGTLTEAVSSSSESNLPGIFDHQVTQSYAPIDPNQFSLKKFRDCTRSELYSPEVSKTHTKKISSFDFYGDQSRQNKYSSERSLNSCYALPTPEALGRDSDEEEEEEECKRPQIPKRLPEEKLKFEQPLKNRNLVLSPLTIKQLKSSPLKLGRSLSISSGDKSRLSKLRDKLSPLRIQNLVQSPFKFGRNIDLFDRKRWRSANDIVQESNAENKCKLVNTKLFNKNQTPRQSLSEIKPSSKSIESVCSLKERDVMNSKFLHGEDSESDSDPSSLGTLIDCDWALDVLDQLSRISDHHGSSFSDDSLKFTKYASWTDLTDLPRQQVTKETKDEKDNLDGIPKVVKEVKANKMSERGAADGGEECADKKSDALNSNSKRNQTLLAENQIGKESTISDDVLQEDFQSGKEKDISIAENISRNPKFKCDNVFEEMFENSAEDIFEDTSVTEEPDSENDVVTTYREFEKDLAPFSQGDLPPKEKNRKGFISSSEDVLDGTTNRDFCSENARTDSSSDLCEKANSAESTDDTSNKSMTGKLDKAQSPQKNRTKTYNAGKSADRKRSRRSNQGRGSKSKKKQPKESPKSSKVRAIPKNLYQDVELSVVHEDHISFSGDSETIQDVACWENWDQYDEEDDNDETLEHFKNSLLQGALSCEVNYPWETSITDSDESNDSGREGAVGVLNNAFLSGEEKKNYCYWPRSRYPKMVSRPVDPLLMPTIHEHRMMTEQFIYDDEETEDYHFDDPQVTIPAYELYDDRRSKINKYSSYFREKSLQSVNDAHPALYMTIPVRDSSRAWNAVNQKNSFLEEFFPKSETESPDSHAFL